jgi:peptidyl-prolyl cis-trans isomerase D
MNQDPSGQQRAYWLYVEREIAQERKQAKYNNLIRQGLYVNPVQARQAWEENNRRVDFEFIVQRFNTIRRQSCRCKPFGDQALLPPEP